MKESSDQWQQLYGKRPTRCLLPVSYMKYPVLCFFLLPCFFTHNLSSFLFRFSDAWQVTPSDCAISLDPWMYGRCCRLSPSHRHTRKRWRTETASTTPDGTPRGLSCGVRACDKLLGYRHPHSRETLPPNRGGDLRTNNMPHRRPVVLPARLLVQRP